MQRIQGMELPAQLDPKPADGAQIEEFTLVHNHVHRSDRQDLCWKLVWATPRALTLIPRGKKGMHSSPTALQLVSFTVLMQFVSPPSPRHVYLAQPLGGCPAHTFILSTFKLISTCNISHVISHPVCKLAWAYFTWSSHLCLGCIAASAPSDCSKSVSEAQ